MKTYLLLRLPENVLSVYCCGLDDKKYVLIHNISGGDAAFEIENEWKDISSGIKYSGSVKLPNEHAGLFLVE